MHTVLALTVVTAGVGYAMVRLGLSKGMLQARRASRRCPSCGRLIGGSVCRVCTGRDR
jgi:recombinational DNA repair protein RecR